MSYEYHDDERKIAIRVCINYLRSSFLLTGILLSSVIIVHIMCCNILCMVFYILVYIYSYLHAALHMFVVYSPKENQAHIPCSSMWFTSQIFSTILQFDLIAYRQVQHRNVVRFIGACTNSPQLCIITGMILSGTKVACFLRDCYHNHFMALCLFCL